VDRENGLVTAVRSGTGSYLLTWNQSVSDCVYLVTVESATAQTTFSDTRLGLAEAVPVTGQPTQVRVFTADKGGSQADRGFSVGVLC
jgi:hypothetical protein